MKITENFVMPSVMVMDLGVSWKIQGTRFLFIIVALILMKSSANGMIKYHVTRIRQIGGKNIGDLITKCNFAA
jgi:hypothetical protein